MDLTINPHRTCAAMPGHQLCVDYQLPAVEKIFTQFLQKHPQITSYNNCQFYINSQGPISKIYCSSGSYHVRAAEKKLRNHNPDLDISLSNDATSDYEKLECDKNGCNALNNHGLHYQFHRYPDGICYESLIHPKRSIPTIYRVPCDGDASLFDEFLKNSPILLPTPQPQYAHTWGAPPVSGNAPFQSPPSFSFHHTGFGAGGNATPQNSTSYLPTGLGAASTLFCLYKTYKELEKIDEEGQRDLEASRVKAKAAGHTVPNALNNNASGWKALGYLGAAIASGAFTYYTLRP